MSRKRVFDIDFDATPEPPAEEVAGLRRGPMATAIGETAEALAERRAAEAAIRDENDRLAHEHVRLKKEGLITDLIPLDEIVTEKLARDRRPVRDAEIDELKASIAAVGLSNPIRVEPCATGGYELVQGWRRLTAFRELRADTGDARYDRIPAGLLARGDALEQLYRRMVDENLVRRDISFAEMAALARAYAADTGTDTDDTGAAIDRLYASAGRQKRHYIKKFAALLDILDETLLHPEALPRALGLSLEKALSERPALRAVLLDALSSRPERDAEEELAIMTAVLGASGPATLPRPRLRASGKTTFKMLRPDGVVHLACTDGRVEMRLDRDFGAVERARLEAAVAAFLAALDGEG